MLSEVQKFPYFVQLSVLRVREENVTILKDYHIETKDPFGLVKLKVNQLLKASECLVRSFKGY